jgi:hypothetical protein
MITIQPGIVVSDTFHDLEGGDFIVRIDAGHSVEKTIAAKFTNVGETLYTLNSAFPAGATGLDAFANADT